VSLSQGRAVCHVVIKDFRNLKHTIFWRFPVTGLYKILWILGIWFKNRRIIYHRSKISHYLRIWFEIWGFFSAQQYFIYRIVCINIIIKVIHWILYLCACMILLGDVVWVPEYVVCSVGSFLGLCVFFFLLSCDECIENQLFCDSCLQRLVSYSNWTVSNHRTFTLQCRPRYSVRTFNSSHFAGFGAPYGREYI
jgi:hypothetical protein